MNTTRGSRTGRVGRILTGLGALLLLIAVALGVFAWQSMSRTYEAIDSAQSAKSGHSLSVTIPAGETRTVWVQDQDPSSVTCRVKDPSGKPVTLEADSNVYVDGGSHTYNRVGEFEATAGGPYVFSCTGAAFGVAEGSGSGGVFGTIGGVFGAIGCGLVGVVVLIVGIVLWVLGRKKTVGPAGTPGAPGSGPQGGPGAWPQGGPGSGFPTWTQEGWAPPAPHPGT